MKIKKFKKEKDKYKIYLDSGKIIETYEDVILENNLLLKKEINKKDIEALEFQTTYSKIYHKLEKLIGTRLRSEKWVRDYLKKIKDIDDNIKEEMIFNLKQTGFIDDERYVEAYTKDKINLSLDGPYKVINDLHKENITDITDTVLNLYTNEIIEEKIIKIINKKNKENKKYMGYILEKRICNYLREMGYSTEDINNYKHLIEPNKNIGEKEFLKAYNKYSKKLKGDDLFRKIKQVLYSHGMKEETISSLIEEKRLEEEEKNW